MTQQRLNTGLKGRKLGALLCLLFLAGSAVVLSSSGDYENVDPDSIYSRNIDRYGHLEYFGFYNAAGEHWNFIDELADFTNITWIAHSRHDLIVERISQAEDVGVEVVLSLQPFLFNSDYTLRDDYLFRISDLVQTLSFEGLLHNIALIYPVDEPLLHAANSKATSRAQMQLDLAQVNADIAELFPDVPRGVIFNHREIVRRNFDLPEGYDWIGFDCYQNLYDCNGRPFTELYSGLLEKMDEEQMLMAVPESWTRYRDYERRPLETTPAYDRRKEDMIRRLHKRMRHHYEIALSEPRFIAFIPFLWSMEPRDDGQKAQGFGVDQFLRRYPEGGERFIRLLRKIGREISSRKYRYPNMSNRQTEDSFWRPRNVYEADILGVSESGVISAWSFNHALPHKSLRMQVAISLEDEEIYTSRIKRSFILDRSLQSESDPKLPGLGIHGYRHHLPRQLRQVLEGEVATLHLRVWGDRAADDKYRELSREIQF